MEEKRKEIQKDIVYIASILSNISSIEGLTITFYRGAKNFECSIMCIQKGEFITEKLLNDNFGIRNIELERKTGMRISFRIVSSKDLDEKVTGFNAMILKEFVNSEILIDRDRRLITLQERLGCTSRNDLGTYFNQTDLDTAVRTLSMKE